MCLVQRNAPHEIFAPAYSDKLSSFKEVSFASIKGTALFTAKGCVFSSVLNANFSIKSGLIVFTRSISLVILQNDRERFKYDDSNEAG